MPNAVTAKRNLPNWGADARLDICQILENKGFFSRGGGGGGLIWAISGLMLAVCFDFTGSLEEQL